MLSEGATLKAGNAPLRLPEAYHSTATHFSPIVLSGEENKASPSRVVSSGSGKDDRANRNLKELKKQLLKQHASQDADTKLSPRQPISPDQKLPQPRSTHSKVASDLSPAKSKSILNAKPVAPKPSIIQSKDRGTLSAPPVTQAVRPLPRQQGKIVPEGSIGLSTDQSILAPNALSSTHPSAQIGSALQHPSPTIAQSAQLNAHTTSVHVTDPVHTLPVVSNTQTNQSLVVSSATMSSPAVIPSYPGMPVMLQRDATTGAVSWLPVVPNMPYWTISPQQAPAVGVMQSASPQTNSTPPTHQPAGAVPQSNSNPRLTDTESQSFSNTISAPSVSNANSTGNPDSRHNNGQVETNSNASNVTIEPQQTTTNTRVTNSHPIESNAAASSDESAPTSQNSGPPTVTVSAATQSAATAATASAATVSASMRVSASRGKTTSTVTATNGQSNTQNAGASVAKVDVVSAQMFASKDNMSGDDRTMNNAQANVAAKKAGKDKKQNAGDKGLSC